MSVSIQTVEFERRDVHLSELDEGPPYTVHGVALGAGDVTVGQSGIKKLWPPDELRKAADSLQGKNLVEDHENSSRGVIGRVTKAGFKDDVGIIYEAELHDDDLAEKIDNGLLEVSIRGHHDDVEEMKEDDDTGAKVVTGVEFDNLSIVPSGAAPSNTIEMGEAEELSVAQLSAFTDELQEEADDELEPGDTVQWDDKHGIILGVPSQSESVEVDVYEQVDDEWRAVGETEEVAVDDLEPWDVDEENIGAMDEDGESDEEEAAKHHHRAAAEQVLDFLDMEENSGGTSLSAFLEWTEDDSTKQAINEFTGEEGRDLENSVNDFGNWLDRKLPDSSEEEEARVEGEEESVGDGTTTEEIKEQSPERYPEESEELQDYSFHTPDWDDSTTSEWSSPNLEDFDTDDLSEIDDHFLISSDGFPPENFGDLKLPVVEPNGDLSRNALEAVKGGRGVSAVEGLSDDMEERIIDWVNKTANDVFDENWGEEEEEAEPHRPQEDGETSTNVESQENEENGSARPTPVHVLSGDDLRHGDSGESKMGGNTVQLQTMTEDIEEQLDELDEPVAVDKSELENLREKADQFEDMNSNLEELRQRTEVLDEVDRDKVDELKEADDPTVVESAHYEELQSEAEQVKTVYAAALSDEVEVFEADELTERFSIEELREKYEEHIGDPEEELTGEPKSGDPDEEELEEKAEEESEEELSGEEKEAEEMRERLRQKITGD